MCVLIILSDDYVAYFADRLNNVALYPAFNDKHILLMAKHHLCAILKLLHEHWPLRRLIQLCQAHLQQTSRRSAFPWLGLVAGHLKSN